MLRFATMLGGFFGFANVKVIALRKSRVQVI